jgi:hypothetical protein
MKILPTETECNLIRQCLAPKIGTRCQQGGHHGCSSLGRFVTCQPVGIAATADLANHVINVLGSKGQALQRPSRSAVDLDRRVAAKGIQLVGEESRLHGSACLSKGIGRSIKPDDGGRKSLGDRPVYARPQKASISRDGTLLCRNLPSGDLALLDALGWRESAVGGKMSLKMFCRALCCLSVLGLSLAGCSDPPPPAPPAAVKLHRIVLIQPHGPIGYVVGSNNAVPNPITDLSTPLQDQTPTTTKFQAEMATAKLNLAAELGKSVEQAMRQHGYEVLVVTCPCSTNPDQLVDNVANLKGKGDAVLDLAIADAGYAYVTGHPYEPRVDLRIRLTNPGDNAVLYEDSVSYTRAWNPQRFNIVLNPTSGYSFGDDGEILADSARAAAGLRSSIPELTRVVMQGVQSPAP